MTAYRREFLRLWGLVQPAARPKFLLLLVVVGLGGLVELAGIGVTAQMMGLVASQGGEMPPGPLSWLLASLEIQAPRERLQAGLVTTIALLAFVHGYTILKSYLRAQFVWIQDKEISTRLFQSVLARPYVWFLQQNSGELQRLLSSGHITQGLLNGMISAAGQLSVALTLSVALILADPPVALVGGLVVAGAYGLVRAFTFSTLHDKGRLAHQYDSQRKVTAQESLTSIRFVKTTARERFFVERYSELSAQAASRMVYHGIYVDTVRAFLEWVTFAGILSLSVFLLAQTSSFEALLPRLTLYTMAGYRIVPAIHELFGLRANFRFHSQFVERLEELFMAAPSVPESGERVQGLETSDTLISLQKVSYSYQDAERAAIKDLSFDFQRGKWYGVVGTTGAGKTTLLDLLSGLVVPTSGLVKVGQSDLTAGVVEDWLSHIAVVPQEVILLDDTVRRNVAFALDDSEVDEDLVLQVCEMAGLSTLLGLMPQGLDTRIGERGTRLSGGERQRVGLARALYRRPKLLLLDEATSALDQATEQTIVNTLEQLGANCTMITVAHRLSSVRPCDQILVLEQGQIVGQGSFDDLLSENTTFRRLALT